jgi:hypothetical protein
MKGGSLASSRTTKRIDSRESEVYIRHIEQTYIQVINNVGLVSTRLVPRWAASPPLTCTPPHDDGGRAETVRMGAK